MPAADFLSHFDYPPEQPPSGAVPVRGWVSGNTGIRSVHSVQGPRLELKLTPRPDVSAAFPQHKHSLGFQGLIPQECFQGDLLVLCCETDTGPELFQKTIPKAQPDQAKKDRLQKLRPLLRTEMPHRETPFHFDFLTQEIRDRAHVTETDAVSAFDYAPMVKELLASLGPEALVLDCGAGYRSVCRPNVINLEIVPYPSTDVLATNEQLPFKDNSFDLVISCAVLEHVRYPFEAAAEIKRVTKPGGLIYADVPFLQPYHGYPSHFYNMTHQGLANLFSDACDIEKSFVPYYGTPVWTLSWFLNSYLAGLPAEERERFASMKVSELLGNPETYLQRPFVTQLSAEKNLELASVTSLLARKRA